MISRKSIITISILFLFLVSPLGGQMHFSNNTVSHVATSSSKSDQINSPGFVYKTILLNNGTVVSGNYVRYVNGINSLSIFHDKINNDLYIGYGNGTVIIYNLTSHMIMKNYVLNQTHNLFFLNKETDEIIAYSSLYDYVYLFNAKTNKIIEGEKTTVKPVYMVYNKYDNLIYAENYNGTISILNPTNLKLVYFLNLFAVKIAYDKLDNLVYVLNFIYNNQFQLISLNGTKIVAKSNETGVPSSMAVNPENNSIYVSSYNKIYVYNLTTFKLKQSFENQFDLGFRNLYYSPENNYLYEINSALDLLEVFNNEGSLVTTIAVGADSYLTYEDVAYNSNSIYFINSGSNTVSIISLNKYEINFVANNIASGSTWDVVLNGQSKSSDFNRISFVEANGSYKYKIIYPSQYSLKNSTGRVNVIGNNVNIQVDFTSNETLYKIIIYSTGLPQGYKWAVTIDNTTERSNNMANNEWYYDFMVFYFPVGVYSYHIYSPGYHVVSAFPINNFNQNNQYSPDVSSLSVLNASGKITVNSDFFPGNVNGYMVYFKIMKYNVTFLEHGLTNGTRWLVTLNGNTVMSNSDEISFFVPNGTYNFNVSTTGTSSRVALPFSALIGYNVSNVSGSVKIESENVLVNETFIRNNSYRYINFTFVGYPTFFPKIISIKNVSEYAFISQNISFLLPEGNYSYFVYNVNISSTSFFNHRENSPNKILVENNMRIFIRYTPSAGYHLVKFQSNIHNNGMYFFEYIMHDGSLLNFVYSDNGTIISYLKNGNYTVLASLTLDTRFYFSATNLLETLSFAVKIGNSRSPYYSDNTTEFIVNGKNETVNLNFYKYYNVTFKVTRLPSSGYWSVTFGGVKKTSRSNNITFYAVENGTYDYEVGSATGYFISPNGGNITLDGTNMNVMITFTRLVKIVFTENGLPLRSNWSVKLGNIYRNSTNSSIVFIVPKGLYTYVVSLPPSYNSSNSTGKIDANQNVTSVFIKVTENGHSYPDIILLPIAASIVVTVTALVIAIKRTSKK